MPRLAANLSTLFLELPMERRPAAAARAGFEAVELRFLDSGPSARFLDEMKANGLQLVLFNAHPGDLGAGELGLAANPAHRQRFEAGFRKDLALAKKLGVPFMHVLAGRREPELSGREQFEAATSAYGWAANQATDAGVTILIEPLAPTAVENYFVPSLEQAISLVEEVGSERFKILFDFYHMQLAGGDIVGRLKSALPLIAHVQIAATPSRAEPDEGELNADFVLGTLDRLGYTGWVGCEYNPRTTTVAGLSWAGKYLHGRTGACMSGQVLEQKTTPTRTPGT